jgi:2-C-methyl-D-erythritol 2,4-cyclodiphosphate synthase
MSRDLPYRIGLGYDLHRLEPLPPRGHGRPMVLAGVRVDHPTGPVSHSDGDAVYHAVTDAILGALGQPDIGQKFPDTDPAHNGKDSSVFLKAATLSMHIAGFSIANIAVVVICQSPKISPIKQAMIENIAACLGCDATQVNMKGKTHEKVDAVGEGRAIEVHAVALLVRTES